MPKTDTIRNVHVHSAYKALYTAYSKNPVKMEELNTARDRLFVLYPAGGTEESKVDHGLVELTPNTKGPTETAIHNTNVKAKSNQIGSVDTQHTHQVTY